MSTRLYTPTKAKSQPTPSFTPMRGGFLQRKCACGGAPGLDGICPKCRSQQLTGLRQPLVQTKLTIGQPGDKYEQEADWMAEAVVRIPESDVQRQQEDEEERDEEEILRTKPVADQITPLIQKQTGEEEKDEDEENLPIRPKAQPGQTPEVAPDLEARINALRGGGQPLSPATRTFMEPRFGYDFSKVRIYTDDRAAQTARAVNARAFTIGPEVVFGAGQYAPGTSEGQRLLAHELTHVVQQGTVGVVRCQTQSQEFCVRHDRHILSRPCSQDFCITSVPVAAHPGWMVYALNAAASGLPGYANRWFKPSLFSTTQ